MAVYATGRGGAFAATCAVRRRRGLARPRESRVVGRQQQRISDLFGMNRDVGEERWWRRRGGDRGVYVTGRGGGAWGAGG